VCLFVCLSTLKLLNRWRYNHELFRAASYGQFKRADKFEFDYCYRRRSSVNFRGARNFCPKNEYEKLTKCPNFRWFLPEKIIKVPEFFWYLPEKKFPILHDFARKMPEFYIIIARKIFFPIFFGGAAPCLLRLWLLCGAQVVVIRRLWTLMFYCTCWGRRCSNRIWVKLGTIVPQVNERSQVKNHAMKLKTSPARLAPLLQPSLAFCFSLQPMTAHWTVRCHWLQAKTKC